MLARLARLSVASTLLMAVGLVGFAGPAAAAEPIVIGDCATTVQGKPGQPIQLSAGAVTAPVVSVVRAVPILGPPLAGAVDKAVRALPPIPIGSVPDGKGGFITGGQIANNVVDALRKLPLLGPILGQVVSGVQGVLSAGCGVTVKTVNAVAAPVQDGANKLPGNSGGPKPPPGTSNPGTPPPGTSTPGTPPPGSSNPGTPPPGAPGTGAPIPDFQLPRLDGSGLYDYGRVPLYDYSGLPVATPGGVGALSPGDRYGQASPGGQAYGLPESDGVSAAGQARALPMDGAGRVAAPVLLAVLALAMVTAALVRTWVLRRIA
ncbi:hypothetical protein JOF53_004461 [Crossiella equi]|uniref:Uncharacterized protein n=1 Tax=Crossiella equi TaxID=130796 RepID=A0ABS5AG78_9PSEU|nr:hypothetical protein [Crossiella equi]MBP2475589.1 hypothetical protein [Crossiella equi]